MKRNLIISLLMLISFTGFTQKNKQVPDTATTWQVYRNAIAFSDWVVAKNALFQISAMQPENKNVYDSLANIYFLIGAYGQAILAAEKANPSAVMQEIQAYSYRNLGDIKKALELFEALSDSAATPENLYQLASLQFSLKRYGECLASVEKIQKLPEISDKKLVITTDNNENMTVSYSAACENLKGVVFIEMGKPELAIPCLEKALAEAPDFALARRNLESIKKPETGK